jgi:perosamine synthetase
LAAALGISQIKKVDKTIKMRMDNAKYYTSKLSDVEEIKLPKSPKDFFHVFQKYTIQTEVEKRDKLMNYLAKKGIFTKPYFGLPIHLTKFYRDMFGYKNGDLPKTEMTSKKVLTLPMSPDLKKEDIDYITDSIKEFF